ncbi:ribosome hibernation-promoting factor, HPF/YfiA family [Sphingomonas nostoxanthinifaciens]|uniref:ribosome hibernation-promoting factor, HPF/YfiA family n=1 Tax=Sphingomonas nostoxanthinifaciens TaxID=2872652 RepID=UPI001CC1C8BD|nr:ribosome-associated translation inhibitor RaiA [Sphingomonas nostoxanthinifaciens]UAK24645.1 ribosome-associated translation inhibitor RaiA [Sphingomonas nostoxanthinifaciens]
MDIRVSGHQVDTGEALRVHVEERLQAIADKYFSRSISAHVTFGHAPHGSFSCDIVAHVMQGVILKGAGQGIEAHPSFDQAADRIETQLRRYMKRLKSRQGVSIGQIDADAGYTVFQSAPEVDEDEVGGDHPPVIAETRVDVPEASVSDAVMMLDLRNTNALLFKNLGTGAFNMVYRRGDGTIGWVEPQRAA